MGGQRVVVTGGAGFIGSHVAEALAQRGYRVVVLDDLSTGRKGNIEQFLSNGDVEFVQGSITDISLLQHAFKGARCVFHLAALPSVPRSIENPAASHEVNATGTLNVLLAARDNAVRRVIYSSSSSVYGDTPTLPKREDMPLNPRSPYAVSKMTGEYYCSVFQQVYALPIVCLRYFNVYGPRQDPASQYAAVIPRFINWISQGNQPVILGDGEQTRDFTFVRDVVAANILAMEKDLNGVFNIGGGRSIAINKLARLVIRLMGNNVEPVYEAARPGDVMHSLADISRAEACGYRPAYSLEEGLRETIRSFNGTRPG
ncbi:MAG TPA: SDR family oxidoreductase [Dehalococcoidia bacterium]|nr:SDR family oxidoreductase [Dehalococcoidia bacterium]